MTTRGARDGNFRGLALEILHKGKAEKSAKKAKYAKKENLAK